MCEDAPCCGCCGPDFLEWEGPEPDAEPDPDEWED